MLHCHGMPYQCVHCSRIIPTATKEILEGCNNCGNKFFFYIREEKLEEVKNQPVELEEKDKKSVEKDIRDMAGIKDEETPVILNLESVRATGPGKYEIDVVNLFRKDRPLIYKLEDGKYIIDLTTTLGKNLRDVKEIEKFDENEEKDN